MGFIVGVLTLFLWTSDLLLSQRPFFCFMSYVSSHPFSALRSLPRIVITSGVMAAQMTDKAMSIRLSLAYWLTQSLPALSHFLSCHASFLKPHCVCVHPLSLCPVDDICTASISQLVEMAPLSSRMGRALGVSFAKPPFFIPHSVCGSVLQKPEK